MNLWMNFKNLKISKSIITTLKQNKQIENQILKFMIVDLQMKPKDKLPKITHPNSKTYPIPNKHPHEI
jgi:ribosomal protein S6